MSTFAVKVVRVDAIEPIVGADAIELAKVADYRSVVRKGDYKAGDLAVYIPESAILPEWLLKDMGLEGKLSGKDHNRVKAIKLRGCLSQGLLLKTEPYRENEVLVISEPHDGNQGSGIYKFGDDVAEDLGIIKYEPIIPSSMAGEVCNIGSENVLKFDIENLKKYPHILEDGEEVSATEKLHGTFMEIGYIPGLNHPELFEDGNVFVCSKGLGAQGLVFKNNEHNTGNVYVKTFKELTKDRKWSSLFRDDCPIYVLGECFGPVQDLTYGLTKPEFRIFDIYVGKPGEGMFLCPEVMQKHVKNIGLQHVDVLYTGPFSKAKMDELCQGNTITGKGVNLLEGIVIKPQFERRHDDIGRVILKHISEKYLLRKDKGATEYN